MRPWLRTLFPSLAVLALVTQTARSTSDGAMASPDLAVRLAAFGLQPAEAIYPDTLGARYPGCPDPLSFVRMDFSGSGSNSANILLEQQVVPRFIYLGLVVNHAATATMLGRWAAAIALQAVGLRKTAVPREMVLAILPAACPQLTRLNWSTLSPWD